MWIEASAPSNIALIKYMGKTDENSNRPVNSSLSFSLEKLRTFVRIQKDPALKTDEWHPLKRADLRPIELSQTGREKFLNHFMYLKKEFKIDGYFQIESANNFPSDCGLASSASSFAALTEVTHEWRQKNSAGPAIRYRPKELAKLSQKGSGSSCRSFFTPWALWHQDGAEAILLPYEKLKHQVILCDESVKSVSSSRAHQFVITSDLFKGRPERAEERLKNLVQAMRKEDWKQSFEICWNEFWDMHVLFHTSKPAFMYMNGLTMKSLKYLNDYWQKNGDGPLVTMDAGSNIHLLYRADQQLAYDQIMNDLRSSSAVWSDEGYLEKH